MFLRSWQLIVLTLFFLLFNLSKSLSQKCDSSFFANSITGDHNEGISINGLATNQQNELLGFGSFAFGNFFSRAWVSKFTSKGNIIWSRQYLNPRYDNIEFNKIITLPDGSSLISGTLFKLDINTRIDLSGILFLKINKFGTIVWSKVIESHHSVSHNSYNMGNIIQAANGDFIMSILVVKDDQSIKYYSSVYILRVTINGDIIWTKRISSKNYMIGNYGFSLSNTDFSTFSQMPDGNIVFGSVIDDYDYTTGNITKEGYYFNKLDFNTGDPVWENTYVLPSATVGPLTGVQKISLLPNGNLSFFADIVQQTGIIKPNRRPVTIITDANGNLLNAVSYYDSNTNADSELADVLLESSSGEQQILITEDILKTGVIISVDKDGKLLNYTGYKGPQGAIGPVAHSLIKAKQGNYFASAERSINKIHLFNVDTSGSLACVNRQVTIVSESSTGQFTKENSSVDIDRVSTADFLDGGVLSLNYNMYSNTDCNVVTCCNDVIDTPIVFNLCNGASVTLPDNSVVKDSGTYYSTYKTITGCDSIGLYKVVTSQSTSSLKVTPDTCLDATGSVTLHASGDFDTFYWMNITTNQPSFMVTSPGTYYVKATNSCGTITDSVHVFEKCNAEVFIPSAFTPNKDGVNELFRVPLQNLNKFIRLQVYNRFGQLIFETSDNTAGWDGTYKNKPQPVGVYIYYLEMQNFNGKPLNRKGIVTLIR